MSRRLIAAVAFAVALFAPAAAQQTATGVVFHDTNGNRVFDAGEPPLADVRVSNGRKIVRTGADGRYELPIGDDTLILVIKPKGWQVPMSEDMLPQFYYNHKPAGSPPSRYRGVAPTGPLPESIDFPLYPNDEPEIFKAVVFADPQPRNIREVEYVFHDVIEELIGTDASFGVTLGDIAFDNLNTLEAQNRGIALIGIPWYNVIGNHDLNMDARTDVHSDETFERIYGPNYYSFDFGNVHFIALDDVDWQFPEGAERGRYAAGLDEQQMEFIRNDLALIPEDQMVVLMMHIPLTQIGNRQQLYRLIEQRPLCLSISGHTHYQEHRFITQEDGWRGPEPHHHIVNVTVSGSWWSGAPDELGIPHTMMRDGAPNGYAIMTFDGKNYSWEFKAARRPADTQMHIWAPERVASAATGNTEIIANVYGGSERSTVEMRLGDGEWIAMRRETREDPFFAALKALEAGDNPPPGRKLPDVIKTPHIWVATLPANVAPGTHLIQVRTTDMFGRQYRGDRIIRVE